MPDSLVKTDVGPNFNIPALKSRQVKKERKKEARKALQENMMQLCTNGPGELLKWLIANDDSPSIFLSDPPFLVKQPIFSLSNEAFAAKSGNRIKGKFWEPNHIDSNSQINPITPREDENMSDNANEDNMTHDLEKTL